MLILDTSGLIAALDLDQRLHWASKEALERAAGPLFVLPFVLTELNYSLVARGGRNAERALLNEVARGTYRLESFAATDVAEAIAVIERYAGSGALGLADASNVVLAERYGVRDILTLDENHFREVPGGGSVSFAPGGFVGLLPVTLSVTLVSRLGGRGGLPAYFRIHRWNRARKAARCK